MSSHAPLHAPPRRWHVPALGVLLALSVTRGAAARPNTHAPAISTWDTRASNIAFGYQGALFGRTTSNILSYSANFASTSGVLLAQFGLHYISYRRRDDEPIARGVSAGGVALFNFPLSERYTNGVPPSAFAFYVGGVPTALIAGRLNFLSVPAVLGAGVPLSPSPSVTLTPWVELSPGLNFDTRINEISTQEAIDSALDGTLTQDEVEALVREGLDAELKTSLGARAGLSASFHLGERVDLDADLTIGGGAFSLGAGLVIRWDEMVPGVRPPAYGDCAEIDERYRACRASRRLPRPAPSPRVAPPPAATGARPTTAPLRAPATTQPGTTRAPADARKKPVLRRPQPKPAPAPQPYPPRTTAPPPQAPAPAPAPDAFPPLKAAPP
jgi:hypothetical protein